MGGVVTDKIRAQVERARAWWPVLVTLVSLVAAMAVAHYRLGAAEAVNAEQAVQMRAMEQEGGRTREQLARIEAKVDLLLDERGGSRRN